MNDETTRGVFEQNIANYFSPSSIDQYTREEGLWSIERELIDRFMPPPPARLLDVGCGAGRTTVGLVDAGFRVTAIDLAKPLIDHARQRRSDIDYRVMDATRLELMDASFDCTLFSYNGLDDIFPVAKRRRCLSEVFRVLRPGGVFILSTHNAIGHLFSGGYFYVRGYWNAAKMLAAQCANRQMRQWYFRYSGPGGAQVLYSAPPELTRAQLVETGFVVVDVRGSTGERNPGRVRMRQRHVYFVARKPA